MSDSKQPETNHRTVWPIEIAPRDGTWIKAWCNGPSTQNGPIATCWQINNGVGYWHVDPHHECFPFAWEAENAD